MTFDVWVALFPMNIELFNLNLFSVFRSYKAPPPGENPSDKKIKELFKNWELLISNLRLDLETITPPVMANESSNNP